MQKTLLISDLQKSDFALFKADKAYLSSILQSVTGAALVLVFKLTNQRALFQKMKTKLSTGCSDVGGDVSGGSKKI